MYELAFTLVLITDGLILLANKHVHIRTYTYLVQYSIQHCVLEEEIVSFHHFLYCKVAYRDVHTYFCIKQPCVGPKKVAP